jgi:hypothetical protein
VNEGHPDEGIWAGASAPADLSSRQPEEIPDLFAGVRKYGLLGLVWFDDVTSYDYRITSPAARPRPTSGPSRNAAAGVTSPI